MDDLENLVLIDNKPTPDEIFSHISYIHNILSTHNIKHWLMYGTLLGCIRNKDIIPYDYDFDFGILISDINNILNINLNNNNYKIQKTTGTLYSKKTKFKKCETKWRISLKVLYKENPVGDLYVYNKNDKDNYMRRYDPNEKILFWPRSIFPSFLIEDKLDYGYIRNLKLPIPKYSICLLEYFYGPMWTVPIQAKSQNGMNHPDYDFYAGYMYSNLGKLNNRIIEEVKKCEGREISFGEPLLSCEEVEYVFPLDQFEWCNENSKYG